MRFNKIALASVLALISSVACNSKSAPNVNDASEINAAATAKKAAVPQKSPFAKLTESQLEDILLQEIGRELRSEVQGWTTVEIDNGSNPDLFSGDLNPYGVTTPVNPYGVPAPVNPYLVKDRSKLDAIVRRIESDRSKQVDKNREVARHALTDLDFTEKVLKSLERMLELPKAHGVYGENSPEYKAIIGAIRESLQGERHFVKYGELASVEWTSNDTEKIKSDKLPAGSWEVAQELAPVIARHFAAKIKE